jgi:hypothetical protein
VKFYSPVIIGFFLFSAGIFSESFADDNPFAVRAPFEKAIIRYEISSATQKGEEMLYIDNYGNSMTRYRRLKVSSMLGDTKKETLTITTPERIFSIDMQAKKGVTFVNPTVYYLEKYSTLAPEEKKRVAEKVKAFGSNMTNRMGGTFRTGGAKFLGYKCDVSVVMGVTSLMLSGTPILLKSESGAEQGHMLMRAVKIDTESELPKGIFTVPENILIKAEPKLDRQNMEIAANLIEDFRKEKKN